MFQLKFFVVIAFVFLTACGGTSDSKTDVGTVNVTVSLTPSAVTIIESGRQLFTATVTGTPNTNVTWSIQEGALGGIVDVTGRYTAPATSGSYHVIATSTVDTKATAIATVSVTARQGDTSYNNYKNFGITPDALPNEAVFANARAFGDFFGDGGKSLILSDLTYWGKPLDQATPAFLHVWKKQNNGAWLQDNSLLPSDLGCLHPRKMVVADFNKDGKPDIFVACHGYDAPPFPGEKNRMILSNSSGYSVSNASNDIGFFHSASAADINGDGYPDIVVTNNFDSKASVHFFINNRDGTFYKDYSRMPTNLGGKGFFSVELVDIDGDGWLDLITGGHEWEGGEGLIFINPKTNNFSSVTPLKIPAVPNEGVLLDFTITEKDGKRYIWVLRSSGGDGTFYQSLTIQKVSYPEMTASVVYSQRPKQWRPWLIPAVSNGTPVITTDNRADGIQINQ